MEEQEKKKRIELEQEQNMSWKMYQILTITACIANLIGTICNFCIHGMKLPTILCGICLLMIVTIGIKMAQTIVAMRKISNTVFLYFRIAFANRSIFPFPFLFFSHEVPYSDFLQIKTKKN